MIKITAKKCCRNNLVLIFHYINVLVPDIETNNTAGWCLIAVTTQAGRIYLLCCPKRLHIKLTNFYMQFVDKAYVTNINGNF